MTLAEQVAAARAALIAAEIPVDALDAAWGAPWRVAILGAEGVGKTTLVNRLTDAGAPTGLGGVTLAVREAALPGVILLDLPAIGHPAWPADLVAEADAAIWVVDGLQPLPASELEAVRRAGCPAVCHAVVARLDLVDPAQVSDVLERVAARLREFAPASVRTLDPRREPLPLHLLVRDGAGLARQRAVCDAISHVEFAPLDLAIVGTWRAIARRAADRLVTETAEAAGRTALRELGSGLKFPRPPSDPTSPLRRLVGGDASIHRERRVAFARWAAEVEVALRERIIARHAPVAAAAEALATLRQAVCTLSVGTP